MQIGSFDDRRTYFQGIVGIVEYAAVYTNCIFCLNLGLPANKQLVKPKG